MNTTFGIVDTGTNAHAQTPPSSWGYLLARQRSHNRSTLVTPGGIPNTPTEGTPT